MILPTPRLIALIGSAAPVAAVLIVMDAGYWLGAAGYLFAVLTAAAVDLAASPTAQSFVMRWRAPSQLFMADVATLEIEFATPRASGLAVDVAVDLNDRLYEIAPTTTWLDDGGFAQLELALRPRRRGVARIDRIWLRWRGPFGLVARTRVEQADREIEALPNLPAVKRAALQLARRGLAQGAKPQLSPGEGVEFDALREHQPGMDTRSIDWKQSARHRTLLSKEFMAERRHHIVLAFDTGQLMREPIGDAPKLDHAINAGLLLAHQALGAGDLVGVYGFDIRPGAFLPPLAGKAAFPKVLAAMNRLEYAHEDANYTLGLGALMQSLRQRTIIVLLTDILDTVSAELMLRNLGPLARRHQLIFVTLREPETDAALARPPETLRDIAEIAVAMDLDDSRQTVLKRLERMGVDPIDVAPNALTTTLLNRYLAIKHRAAAAALG